MSTYASIHRMRKMLANTLAWLDEASAHVAPSTVER